MKERKDKVVANGCGVFWGDEKSILELVVIDYTKNH